MKPDNLAMGRGPKANVVYLLDFGLARSYRDAMTLIHHPPEQGAGKTGNYRYCSMRAHAGEVRGCCWGGSLAGNQLCLHF
jgi:hypothetical protein